MNVALDHICVHSIKWKRISSSGYTNISNDATLQTYYMIRNLSLDRWSEVKHPTFGSWRHPTILNIEEWVEDIFLYKKYRDEEWKTWFRASVRQRDNIKVGVTS